MNVSLVAEGEERFSGLTEAEVRATLSASEGMADLPRLAEGEEWWTMLLGREPNEEPVEVVRLSRFEEVQQELAEWKMAAGAEAEMFDGEQAIAKRLRADLGRAQEFSLTVEERQAILAAVEFYLTSHDGCHEAESGATHSGYAKLAEALAEARGRREDG